MSDNDNAQTDRARFLLQFRHLGGEVGLAFPCDALGRVELDSLSNRELNNYLFARALRCRDYGLPEVITG